MNVHISGRVLEWLTRHFDYYTVVAIKCFSTNVSSFILGVIFATILAAFVLKDTRIIPDNDVDPEEMNITQLKKKGRSMIVISTSPTEAFRIPLITAVILLVKSIIVKTCPFVKDFKIVDKRIVRFWWMSLIAIISLICILCITLDTHIIIPAANNSYVVKDLINTAKSK